MQDTHRWQHHRDTKQLLQSVQLKQNKSVIDTIISITSLAVTYSNQYSNLYRAATLQNPYFPTSRYVKLRLRSP